MSFGFAAGVNPPAMKSRDPRGVVLFAFAVALAIYFAWLLRDVLVLIYVSALFAVVLLPVVRCITRLRIGRWQPGRAMAVLLLLLSVLIAIMLFAFFAIPPVVRDLREFGKELPKRGPELLQRLESLPLLQHVDFDSLNEKLQDFATNFASWLIHSASGWASAVFRIITGAVLTIYFILEGENAYSWLLSFVPTERRQRLNLTLGRAEVRMGRWLLGQGSLMLILGISSTIVFALLHIRYAYALGVVMGLFNIVPIVGAIVSVSLVLLVAAIDSWGRVLGVIIFYAIYAQVETSWLTPRIMQTQVNLAGLAVLIALLLGSSLAGVVGAMVAVPTAVLVAVLLNEYAAQDDLVVTPADISSVNK
ncbi:AI-2E family transporter [Paracidobacterium acidisoli]|uniref:AI-2E family transporter n=1 Tax=Paracidobacterium acidisoli TaxID=2303751 RepID=A0A372IT69_9BACT|nr:AI-2E family transporter [Paracidobacterium acidisoli]MBT9330528.1 AI-2E family transporter [Paracidobacterium acidisoli]